MASLTQPKTNRRAQRRHWQGAVVGAAIVPFLASAAAGLTRVTEYTYNADGAVTAISTSINGGAPETTYLTWDNFVPTGSDPSTGEVRPNNGRLAALGSAPGMESADETFRFDARDRLVGYDGPAGDEIYDYHANGGMSSSSQGSDALHFFYDKSGDAKVTNIHQDATDAWSGWLDRIRYLNDGTEQVLLRPRKDLACSYDAERELVDGYSYDDAFGDSPLRTLPPGSYDLSDNPFGYTGEYRDPLWGGYYLRQRWYHPGLTIFLSRDDEANLGRYNYTAGNPVMRTDPSGMSFSYMHEIGNPLGTFLAAVNRSPGGHLARLFLAPILGPLEIVANPAAFWKAVKTNQDGIDIFLVASIATQAIGGSFAAGSTVSLTRIIVAQTIVQVALGTAQSAIAAAGRGSHHFDWNTFVQGLEYTASGAFYGALATGAIRSLARPGVAQIANNLDTVPDDASLTHTPSRSAGIIRPRSISSASDDANGLATYHDELLSSADDEEQAFKRIESRIQEQGDEIIKAKKQVRQTRKLESRARRKSAARIFNAKQKQLAAPVSKPPDFFLIPEEDEEESSTAFSSNQAEVHAHSIVQELE